MASVSTITTGELGAVPTLPVYRFSLDQYQAMIEAGVLSSRDRVELLDGWIIPKMTKNPPHVLATARLHDQLVGLVTAGWFVAKEDPIVIGASLPEPDLAVIRGQRSDFRERHPAASDVAIIVEVADTSLARDLGEKRRIYAQARVPEYWVFDVSGEAVQAFSQPRGDDYGQQRRLGVADEVAVSLDGRVVGMIRVRDVLR